MALPFLSDEIWPAVLPESSYTCRPGKTRANERHIMGGKRRDLHFPPDRSIYWHDGIALGLVADQIVSLLHVGKEELAARHIGEVGVAFRRPWDGPAEAGPHARYFIRCDDFSFSRQISSTNSVSTTMRWFSVTVQGLV